MELISKYKKENDCEQQKFVEIIVTSEIIFMKITYDGLCFVF